MNSRPQSAEVVSLATASALDLNLRALRPLLTRTDVTELCINQPGVAYLETREGWQREAIPFADFDWCRRLAKLVANSTRQRVDEESPLLSASLPSGERIQIEDRSLPYGDILLFIHGEMVPDEKIRFHRTGVRRAHPGDGARSGAVRCLRGVASGDCGMSILES